MNSYHTPPYPWQQAQWDYLHRRNKNNNLPHALLFSGPRGLGKRIFAVTFLKALLCNQPHNNFACGQCSSCNLLTAGSYPDFYCIEPEGESKVIRIDQIRNLRDQINQTTARDGQYKIVLISPSETLQAGAANALLKILEEPSGKTLFMLLSHQAGLIPATIRSRCQMLTFAPPTLQIAKNWLQNQEPPIQNQEVLLKLAENAPLLAIQLHEQANLTLRQKILEGLSAIKNFADPIQLAAGFLKASFEDFLAWLVTITLDLIRLKQGLSFVWLANSDQLAVLQNLAQAVNSKQLFLLLDQLYELKRFKNNNLNQQLTLENLFCSWYEYTTSHSVN